MDEVARLLTLLALVGAALTLAGSAIVWFLDETRRIQRTLTLALGAPPQPVLTARGRGVGIGFDLRTSRVVVVWDKGAWRMDYRLDELMGVELVVDRQVAARAFRNEARRPLDHLADPEERVRLRFVFDDPAHPDFLIDLWRAEDEDVRGRLTADDALLEANRWVSRMEALLRRPAAARPTSSTAPATVMASLPAPSPAVDTLSDGWNAYDHEEDETGSPPWDDEPADRPGAIT